MLIPLPTPQEMTHWDHLTVSDFGLSGRILMENASREAVFVLKKHFGTLKNKSTIIFAGPGNNGGDGFALARHLFNKGAKVLILHAKKQHEYAGDSAYHLHLAEKMGVACAYLPEYELDFLPKIDLVIDALFGTGFLGPLRPEALGWIKSINKLAQDSFVLSLDIPSGLSGATGEPMPLAVRAHATISFEETKLGLFLPPAQPFVGQLHVGKIGIPRHIKESNPTSHVALGPDLVKLLTQPSPTMHKGEAGHVLILGGSSGLTGAPLLAARGAYRSGAGLVTWGCPHQLTPAAAFFPEVMTLGLDAGQDWTASCQDILQDHIHRFSAVVLGPGLGRTSGAMEFLRAYVQSPHPNTLYDADALFLLAQSQELLELLPASAVLTPHPGEMGNFFNVSPQTINMDRVKYAREFAFAHKINLVLKGAVSIISGPADPVALAPFCSSNLAVAGSGDVLSGIIGSLLARGFPPLTAAQLGVYWHGYAGMLLAQEFPFRGNTPTDIADYLPATLKEWNNAHRQRYHDHQCHHHPS